METTDLALLLTRLWLGTVMIAHGINHGRSLAGPTSWFKSKGFRHPELVARASSLGEIAIGLGLAVGLLTSVAAAGLIASMTVAFGSIHRFAGFFVFRRPDEGYEYVATLAVTALAVAMIGPGSVSLDGAIGLTDALDGWTGLGVAVGGVVAGIAQLVIGWSRPEKVAS